MDASSLIDNARDSYITGLSAQVTKKTRAQAPAPGADAGADTAQQEKVRAAAQDFEAFFIGQMMEHMMAGIEPDSMFGGGHGEQMWRSMLNQEYGKELAKSGRLGIADHVMRGMLAAQEQRDAERGLAPARGAGEDPQSPVQPVVMPIRRSA